MGNTYRGWIPNVTGALSFGTFGEVSHPPLPISANRADRLTRYVICYQTRDKSDVQLPFRQFLGPILFKIQGRIWFLCVGVTSPSKPAGQDYLSGRVFLFNDKSTWHTTVEPMISQSQDYLNAFEFGRTTQTIKEYFDDTYVELQERVAPLSIFNLGFRLHRSGVITIELPENMVRVENAPKFPTGEPEKSFMKHLVTAQAFYFLRDIGHRHQHHDPNTDIIVDIHELPERDDLTWRKLTLFGLYRHIIRYKRKYDAEIFYNALGVLAYARAFREICKRDVDGNEINDDEMPLYLSDDLRMSVEAVHSKAVAERSESARNSEIVRNVLLSVFGLAISLSSVISITEYKIKDPSEFLRFLATMLVQQPVTAGAVLIMTIYAFLIMRGIVDPRRWRITRTAIRLVQPFHKEVTIGVFTTIAILCALVAYYWGT